MHEDGLKEVHTSNLTILLSYHFTNNSLKAINEHKLVQSCRVHCLFTGQFNAKDYGTFADVIKSIGGSTSCSSPIIFILAPNMSFCSIVLIGARFVRPDKYNNYINRHLNVVNMIPGSSLFRKKLALESADDGTEGHQSQFSDLDPTRCFELLSEIDLWTKLVSIPS